MARSVAGQQVRGRLQDQAPVAGRIGAFTGLAGHHLGSSQA
jgi:hypothetical protein